MRHNDTGFLQRLVDAAALQLQEWKMENLLVELQPATGGDDMSDKNQAPGFTPDDDDNGTGHQAGPDVREAIARLRDSLAELTRREAAAQSKNPWPFLASADGEPDDHPLTCQYCGTIFTLQNGGATFEGKCACLRCEPHLNRDVVLPTLNRQARPTLLQVCEIGREPDPTQQRPVVGPLPRSLAREDAERHALAASDDE